MNKYQKHLSSIKDMSSSLLSEGKTVRIKAHGYSMYPSIRPGSIIIIEPLSLKGDPKPGEIIAIRRENGMVVHRLLRITIKNGVRYYIARGDSNAFTDAPITIDRISGRVIKAESSGENPRVADVRIKTRTHFFYNRIRVIAILLVKKLRT
jgi:signal peptidase I